MALARLAAYFDDRDRTIDYQRDYSRLLADAERQLLCGQAWLPRAAMIVHIPAGSWFVKASARITPAQFGTSPTKRAEACGSSAKVTTVVTRPKARGHPPRQAGGNRAAADSSSSANGEPSAAYPGGECFPLGRGEGQSRALGVLESRTATTPGRLRATSTQVDPFAL
jgi:hypothetical protein